MPSPAQIKAVKEAAAEERIREYHQMQMEEGDDLTISSSKGRGRRYKLRRYGKTKRRNGKTKRRNGKTKRTRRIR